MSQLAGLALDEHGCFTDKPSAICTASGGRISPLRPRLSDIVIEDIARGLANGCRWNGQCEFYSVAEHCVHVSHMVPTLEALMHDASEAYISDMARPIKTRTRMGKLYMKHEAVLEERIAAKFGLEFPWVPEIKAADYAMGFAEAKVLLPMLGELMPPVDVWTPEIKMWSPGVAYRKFMKRFRELEEARS